MGLAPNRNLDRDGSSKDHGATGDYRIFRSKLDRDQPERTCDVETGLTATKW